MENRLIDFIGGQADLAVACPARSATPASASTRTSSCLLRGVRFAVRFDLTIEPATLDAIREMADQIHIVSAERIADELKKILVLPRRARGMALFMDLGLARAVLPEIVSLRGAPAVSAVGATEDCWAQVLRALDCLQENPPFPLAFACLLRRVEDRPGRRRAAGDLQADSIVDSRKRTRRLAGGESRRSARRAKMRRAREKNPGPSSRARARGPQSSRNAGRWK